jgi:Leucine-rich repeat (LRR) protein
MKNRKLLFSLGLLAGIACIHPVRAQDLVQDTLAVRILLDQNGLTSMPVSQVVTVESERVTALKLTGLQLLSLPPQIGVLDQLKYMTLTDNLLDSLPDQLWDLANLVELDLGGNRLAALSPKVAKLDKLLLLGLRDNDLPSLPVEVYALPNVSTLLLAGNQLDTLAEAIADPPFLKYVDASGNQLRSVPYTMAAMDLDSLDLSSNVMVSLPDLITGMKAQTRVHLASNRLCDLGSSLDAWAQGKDPGYKASQVCGAAVRRTASRAGAPSLRAFRDGNSLRLDFRGLGNVQGTVEIALRDLAGRTALRLEAPAGIREMSIPSAALAGRNGFLWAELRVNGKPLFTVPVVPR